MADNGDEMIEALEDLVKEGKIRSYGWSTDIKESAEVMSKGEHCDMMELELSVLNPKNETLQVCEDNNLAALIRSPLAGGGLFGKETPATKRAGGKINIEDIKDILTSDGRTVVQGALAWLWAKSENAIPIPGFRSMEQLDGLLGALECGALSDEQMKEIGGIIEK